MQKILLFRPPCTCPPIIVADMSISTAFRYVPWSRIVVKGHVPTYFPEVKLHKYYVSFQVSITVSVCAYVFAKKGAFFIWRNKQILDLVVNWIVLIRNSMLRFFFLFYFIFSKTMLLQKTEGKCLRKYFINLLV